MVNTFAQLEDICTEKNKTIYEVAQNEAANQNDTTIEHIREFTKKSLQAMQEAISTGIKSSELSQSGMCGADCRKVQDTFSKTQPVFGKLFEKILTYSLATAEENIRMGKIVACPTAGSCGILPSVLISIGEEYEKTEEELINALITAGEIGKIIATKVSLAGAVAGCQAECGAASAMSAAAACQLLGGSVGQILNAATLALKNILGLTCDPVAGLVEVPCVKRNTFMGVHAITAAQLALCGVESKIPPDEVVEAMEQTGLLMSPTLKESSQAGLATTPTALKIKQQVFGMVIPRI